MTRDRVVAELRGLASAIEALARMYGRESINEIELLKLLGETTNMGGESVATALKEVTSHPVLFGRKEG